MNTHTIVAITLAISLAAGGGFWVGRSNTPSTSVEQASGSSTARKILYYRNPMGLPDTSPVPKKDPMGMDYIAVYEGDGTAANAPGSTNTLTISLDKVQKLGVRVEAVTLTPWERQISAAGRIEPNERQVYTIAPKFEGYVERLLVSATGQSVARGQALFEVYSPELISAQREYAIAAQGIEALQSSGKETQDSMRQLSESSLARLRNWGISEDQLRGLTKGSDFRRTLTLHSPVAGVVIEKKAIQGMRFMPGEMLYQLADLSSVWVIADVFEQDLAAITLGAKTRIRLDAYPDKTFTGTVAYISPTLNTETRTVPVRIELANPGFQLKPGMFVRIEAHTAGKTRVLTIPESAVIDSGTRQIVLVQTGEGRFEPRTTKLGSRSGDRVEVLEGLREGEQVVVTANFLLDAESNLKAAMASFGPPATPAPVHTIGHQATGKVEEVDPKTGTVTLAHTPIPELKWPAMTMAFQVANNALLPSLKLGTQVSFEFVERGQGEWVITKATPIINHQPTASSQAHPSPSGK